MTTTTAFSASIINDCLRTSTGYGKMLLADIPADKFTHMPHPTMNHPAWCVGHLAIIPDFGMHMMGMEDRRDPRDAYEPLFNMGSECKADASIYPAKDDLVAYYLDRHAALGKALEEVDEAVLRRENPESGRFKEMCPTVGAAINFFAGAHHMVHLGQISAWRRAVGLPPVM
jgi:hypothetical protein